MFLEIVSVLKNKRKLIRPMMVCYGNQSPKWKLHNCNNSSIVRERWRCILGILCKECWEWLRCNQIPSDACVLRESTSKGIVHITDASKQYQHVVIQFLAAWNVSAKEIYRWMQNVYCTKCITHRSVFRWCKCFHSWRILHALV